MFSRRDLSMMCTTLLFEAVGLPLRVLTHRRGGVDFGGLNVRLQQLPFTLLQQ